MNEISVLDYSLPDVCLLDEDENRFLVWIPDKTYIVLGASNKVDDAVIEESAVRDEIPVVKRRSGGQTVMLTPKNVVISAIFTDEMAQKPQEVFVKFNEIIMSVIKKNGVSGVAPRGISDIAVGEKKILGSSIYRKKEKLMYHAVLNYGESPKTFEKYLKHPSKEPDYRQGRSHDEFVTSLQDVGYSLDINKLKEDLQIELQSINS